MDLDLLAGIRTPQDLKRIPIGRLPELAAEIRWAICNQIRKSGGHLAPNLGVVELTIASTTSSISDTIGCSLTSATSATPINS